MEKVKADYVKSCPCEFEEVAPCTKKCSCGYPGLTGGCSRCCKYGSTEQRAEHAKELAKNIDFAIEFWDWAKKAFGKPSEKF